MSSYIMDLRKRVGHRQLLQVGASVIVEDPQGRILLQKRADNHCWGYAGGSVELEEPVEDAARRELLEETGLTALDLELFGIFSGPDYSYTYPNGDQVSNVDIVFLCRSYTGTLRCQPEEVEALRFFPAQEIPENISPPLRKPIAKWVSSRQAAAASPQSPAGETQLSRALSGRLFDAHSPELLALKQPTHNLCQDYNGTREDDPCRRSIMEQILAGVGEGSYFQGPIQFNYGRNTTVGSHCYFNFGLTVLYDAPVTIGDHVMIGPNGSLMASSHPLLWQEREQLTYPDGHVSMSEYARPIVIGDHVWLGAGVTVCGGVTIGEGTVVGAGSVVTRDLPAGYLCCGVPCRPLRPITQEDSAMALL